MSTKDDLLALADRIDELPAYSGHELEAGLYQIDQSKDTATRDTAVILINEKWRKSLAAALRVSVGSA